MKIKVFTQSAIRLEEDKVIYFDPIKIKEDLFDADMVFITHDHYDHFEVSSIKKVINDQSVLIVPKCLEEEALKVTDKVVVVEPGKNYTIGNISFETIPAYNLDKMFHPKEKGYVGYNVLINNKKYYIMGDTDATEEALNVTTDVCFVPIGGTYTMGMIEASAYINKLRPKKVIPIHYGSIVGDKSLGEEFKEKIDKEIEVEILL